MQKRFIKNFDALPLSFEPNQGQSNSDAKFIAKGRGFSALFKDNEADLVLDRRDSTPRLLRVTLLNASNQAAVAGEKRLPGTVNYFIGNDPKKWHARLPTFGRLRYSGVYPGTDLIYYGSQGRLEFDFQLSPGADPGAIRMQLGGAHSLKIDRDGDLTVTTPGGACISFQRPVIYQPTRGNGKAPVAGGFRISGKNTIEFVLAAYDHSRPLIIDPIFNYSTYIGPNAEARSIAVDSAGEAYVTGWTSPGYPTATGWSLPGLPTTPGSFQPIYKDTQYYNSSPFVAKFNSTGTALVYCTYLSGTGNDSADTVAIDAAGDAYVAGTAGSSDFPITTGALQTTNLAAGKTAYTPEGSTGFVTELNSTGTALVYSTYLGGSTYAQVNGIVVDASGNAYVAGETEDTDFPTTAGAFQTTTSVKPEGEFSAFVSKINPTGTALIYSTYLRGDGTDYANAISTDSSGATYVGGGTTSATFPLTAGAVDSHLNSGIEPTGFVTKLNATGSALEYSTYLGGSGSSVVSAIALDSNGDVYATGNTTSPDFPITSGAFQSNIGYTSFGYPQTNAFASKLNSSATALLYSTFLGGSISLGPYADEGDQATAIAVDGSGTVYLTGMACTGGYPVTAGAFLTQNWDGETSGECTAFLTKLNPTPNTPLLYSTFLGGTGNGDAGDWFYGEKGVGLALDSSGNVYIAGFTLSVDFPVTPGVVAGTSSATLYEGMFVTEFNGSELQTLPIPTLSVTSSANPVQYGTPVTLTAKLQSSSGGSTPTGVVAFSYLQKELSDESQVGMGPWTIEPVDGSGTATFSSSSFMGLNEPVSVHYLGDANNAPVNVNYTQVWTPLPTVTTLASSAASAPYGSPITFTATVVDSNGNVPSGTVLFYGTGGTTAFVGIDPTHSPAVWVNGTFSGADADTLPVGNDQITAEFMSETGIDQNSYSVALPEVITSLGVTPAPTINPPGGTYISTQEVTLGDSLASANLYYTTDGSTPVPGTSSQFFSGQVINVNTGLTINAIAQAPGYSPSSEVSATYAFPPGFAGWGFTNPSITTGPGWTSENTATVNVIGINGFSGTVSLTCTVTTLMTAVHDMPTCSLNPASIAVNSSGAQASTLTVSTTAPASAANGTKGPFGPLQAPAVLALAVFWGASRGKHKRWTMLGLLLISVGLGTFGCGGGGGGGFAGGGGTGSGGGGSNGNSGTTLGAYTITVTGTSGTITANIATVPLTVQ